jgi:hypothetical protein
MRKKRRASSRLPWVIGAGLIAGPTPLVRAAAPELAPVIDIELDVADLPETRAKLANTVALELNRSLAEQDPLPAGVIMADDRSVVVVLRPGPIPGADDVLVHVALRLDGAKLAESTTEACLSCSDTDVAEKALVLLQPMLPKLPAPPEAVGPAPSAEHDATEDTPPPEAESARGSNALLISGGAMLGAGVVGLGVGIGLFVVNERVVSPPRALDFEVIKYREPGIATMAIGGAAAVTGAVLLGLALREQRRANLAAIPIAGPHAVGILFSGQF